MSQIKRIRIVISQPPFGKTPKEWDCTVEELRSFEKLVQGRAKLCHIALKHGTNWIGKEGNDQYLHPGEDQCKWCKAKADCPSFAKLVGDTVLGDFDTLQAAEEVPEVKYKWTPIEPHLLASYFLKLPLIRMWCDAVEAKAKAEAHAGNLRPEHGLKLVLGRQGRRAWTDEEKAEELMKSMRVKEDQMYTRKLISPTKAEELHAAGGIGPRQWPKVAAMIFQPQGNPTLVHVSDKRPAIDVKPTADHFEVVPDPVPSNTADDLL